MSCKLLRLACIRSALRFGGFPPSFPQFNQLVSLISEPHIVFKGQYFLAHLSRVITGVGNVKVDGSG